MEQRIFELLADTEPVSIDSPYNYNGIPIPRVTTILSDMLHEEYLMNWANNVGLYQKKKHTYFTELACDIGTYAHKGFEITVKRSILTIEDFPFDELQIPQHLYKNVYNAIASFIQWWSTLKRYHMVEVLMQEHELICQWYGGTVDCVLRIDGQVYVIDFKTSKHSSYKYHLQLAAYIMILETVYNLHVDGAVILMLNKDKISFSEQYMNFTNYPQHAEYLNSLKTAFLSLVYAYYNRKNVEMHYNYFMEEERDESIRDTQSQN